MSNAETHHQLSRQCFGERRTADAFRHARRACELSDWGDPAICMNFGFLANAVLATAGTARVAALRVRCETDQRIAGASTDTATVSVLLYAETNADAMTARL